MIAGLFTFFGILVVWCALDLTNRIEGTHTPSRLFQHWTAKGVAVAGLAGMGTWLAALCVVLLAAPAHLDSLMLAGGVLVGGDHPGVRRHAAATEAGRPPQSGRDELERRADRRQRGPAGGTGG